MGDNLPAVPLGTGRTATGMTAAWRNPTITAATPSSRRSDETWWWMSRPAPAGGSSPHIMWMSRLTRTGRWAERTRFMGEGLVGKVVGSIACANDDRDLWPVGDPAVSQTMLRAL